MSQNLQNSEPVGTSKEIMQCEMPVTSLGPEVTATQGIPQSPITCCCGCEVCDGICASEARILELEDERDAAIWVAQKALAMVNGNREKATILRVILDSICPKQHAVIRETDTHAQTSQKDGRIADLEAELKKKSRTLAMHENPDNPTRTGTAFAAERRQFHANEQAKQAVASDGTECDEKEDKKNGEKDATPDSHVNTCESEECLKCGTDKTCEVCKIFEDPLPVPADFGFDVDVSELNGQKDKVAGRRSPGHQPGVPGVSHNRQPDPALAVASKQELCGKCNGADVDFKTTYRPVIEAVFNSAIGDGLNAEYRIRQIIEAIKQEMGAGLDQAQLSDLTDQIAEKVIKAVSESIVCYTETITYAECRRCNVRTYPDGTHTIPGSTFGPNLRAIVINLHRMTTAVRPIQYGLMSNHGVKVSTGAISNCLGAIAQYAEHGRIRKIPPLSDSEEPEVPPTGSAPIAECGDIRDISPDHTRTCLDTPPIIAQIIDKITMAPYIEFDESTARVKNKKWQALVVLTIYAILIKIKPSRSKITIKTEFEGLGILKRPAGADMYRAGNALKGDFQTCIIHIDRKFEYFAIRAKDGSWEYVLWKAWKKIFVYISDINKVITVLAGGPDKTACDIGVALRKNPTLKEFADAAEDSVQQKLDAIADAYENVDVTRKQSRKMAVTARNAKPYVCTSSRHPGMPPHTNDIERAIRQHHVRPRNIYRSLPNEQAAETLGILQTIHANAQLLGITSGEMISCRNGPRDLYNTGIPPPIFGGGAGVRKDNTAI